MKVFLDAVPETRAVRRVDELRAKGEDIESAQAGREMAERDHRDRTVAESPLVQAPDAVYLDTPCSARTRWNKPFSGSFGAHGERQGSGSIVSQEGSTLKDVLVMKFGGTSMGSADRIRIAAQLTAEERRKRPVVIVVSAMSKITDPPLETLNHAEAGRPEVEANLKRLKQRHFEACEGLLEPPSGHTPSRAWNLSSPSSSASPTAS